MVLHKARNSTTILLTSRYLDRYFVRGDSCPSSTNCDCGMLVFSAPALRAAAATAMAAAME